MIKTHKDLDVWKKAVELINIIYSTSSCFPREERYGLTNQIRRASVSIPANIAEGAARRTQKEYIHFLYVALGSVSELDTLIIIAKNLNYLRENAYKTIMEYLFNIKRLLLGLIRSVSSEKQEVKSE